MWVGLTPIAVPTVMERGDYSYGVYLYHFLLLQAMEQMFGFTWHGRRCLPVCGRWRFLPYSAGISSKSRP